MIIRKFLFCLVLFALAAVGFAALKSDVSTSAPSAAVPSVLKDRFSVKTGPAVAIEKTRPDKTFVVDLPGKTIRTSPSASRTTVRAPLVNDRPSALTSKIERPRPRRVYFALAGPSTIPDSTEPVNATTFNQNEAFTGLGLSNFARARI